MSTRVAVFVDFANIEIAFQDIKRVHDHLQSTFIDFTKIVNSFTKGCEIITQSIYLGSVENGRFKNQHFIKDLRESGFRVVAKKFKKIYNKGRIKHKADFDVEITYDACRHIWRRECDKIILVTGDSDFTYLVENTLQHNIPITIISLDNCLSKELRRSGADLEILDEKVIEKYVSRKN
jgi:uncharacterized LabA/DUF88 family protein